MFKELNATPETSSGRGRLLTVSIIRGNRNEHRTDYVEHYDLVADPLEKNNLKKKQRETAKQQTNLVLLIHRLKHKLEI